MSDDLFRPVSAPWTGVSPALATARRVVLVPPLLLLALVPAALAGLLDGPGWLRAVLAGAALALLVGAAWAWVWAERNRRSWGYAEDEADLLVGAAAAAIREVTEA